MLWGNIKKSYSQRTMFCQAVRHKRKAQLVCTVLLLIVLGAFSCCPLLLLGPSFLMACGVSAAIIGAAAKCQTCFYNSKPRPILAKADSCRYPGPLDKSSGYRRLWLCLDHFKLHYSSSIGMVP